MSESQTVSKGIGIMGMATLVLPMMDAVAKWLSVVDVLPPATVSFVRFIVQVVLMALILVVMRGIGSLRAKAMGGNLLRGLLMGTGSISFFTALKYMPLADATALFFAEPLMVTALSAIFLKEDVGWRRWTAVAVGFVGALIVIQPSWALFGAVSLLPLLTAFVFSVYMLLNRVLSRSDGPMVMQLYAGLGGAILVGVVLMTANPLFGLSDLSFELPRAGASWGLILLIGVLGTLGHILIVQALKHAPASLLAPFTYLEIVGAVLIGLALFGDFPTPSKWLGIAIIIGSGLYVYFREGAKGPAKEAEIAQ